MDMERVFIMDHPLIQHKIGIMRKSTTGTNEFHHLVKEVAMLICFEATRGLKLHDIEVETPICRTTAKELSGKKLAVVPILRAGLGLSDGILELIPAAKVGHIGVYRNPDTLEPVNYYCKLPDDCASREVFVVDPMLATGGSAKFAIDQLKLAGCQGIHFLCLIAAPEGIKTLREAHPDVDLYIGALDDWTVSTNMATLFLVLVTQEIEYSVQNDTANLLPCPFASHLHDAGLFHVNFSYKKCPLPYRGH